MSDLPEEIFGAWIHSHEEDTEGVQVYRARGHSFPPSRGRRGFEVHRGGEFTFLGIAPADGSRPVPGHWHNLGEGRVEAVFPDRPGQVFRFTIVSCDKDVLRINLDQE